MGQALSCKKQITQQNIPQKEDDKMDLSKLTPEEREQVKIFMKIKKYEQISREAEDKYEKVKENVNQANKKEQALRLQRKQAYEKAKECQKQNDTVKGLDDRILGAQYSHQSFLKQQEQIAAYKAMVEDCIVMTRENYQLQKENIQDMAEEFVERLRNQQQAFQHYDMIKQFMKEQVQGQVEGVDDIEKELMAEIEAEQNQAKQQVQNQQVKQQSVKQGGQPIAMSV